MQLFVLKLRITRIASIFVLSHVGAHHLPGHIVSLLT